MTDKDEEVRYNVKMRQQLREDAKRNTKRGELAEDVRDLFRRRAYGEQAAGETTELQRTKSELREVRERLEELRHERGKIQNEIESQERRAARLEERIEQLDQQNDQLEQAVEMLENMLQNGDRMWPTRIKTAADVDVSTAEQLYQQLKDRNPELPAVAFEEPHIHDPNDWRELD